MGRSWYTSKTVGIYKLILSHLIIRLASGLVAIVQVGYEMVDGLIGLTVRRDGK